MRFDNQSKSSIFKFGELKPSILIFERRNLWLKRPWWWQVTNHNQTYQRGTINKPLAERLKVHTHANQLFYIVSDAYSGLIIAEEKDNGIRKNESRTGEGVPPEASVQNNVVRRDELQASTDRRIKASIKTFRPAKEPNGKLTKIKCNMLTLRERLGPSKEMTLEDWHLRAQNDKQVTRAPNLLRYRPITDISRLSFFEGTYSQVRKFSRKTDLHKSSICERDTVRKVVLDN